MANVCNRKIENVCLYAKRHACLSKLILFNMDRIIFLLRSSIDIVKILPDI